uniref:peptidase n=1 Tax=uncultured Bifidobacterium sp. TaxID=165187 RepID=UPI0028DBA9C6
TRVDELWEESARLAPLEIRVEQVVGEGSFSGSVRVLVVNSLGEPVVAVPYEVSLDGPASFDGGVSVVTGVSAADWTEHAWTAEDAGTMTVEASFSRGRVERAVSSQDFVRVGSPSVASDIEVFFVRKDFVPSLATRVPARVLDQGSTVEDEVSVGVVENPAGWVAGLELEAEGWYFEGLPWGMFGEGVSPDPDETAPEFLARLENRGFAPVGYGRALFASAGQSVTVQAVTEPGGTTPYRTSGAGLGTWVWAFSRESLSDAAEDFVLADVVTPFLEMPETVSVRARPTVKSSVTEHEVRIGAEIEDVITVSGFPDDHGSFEGDDAWDLAADEPVARVSLWWAGDADDPSATDSFRPDGPSAPAQDEHHRLVETWEYPAGNGELRVGGGAPDIHGKPVRIIAEDHGWYVFVWSFAGDDRVMPSSSAYDDPWERVRVVPADEPEIPALSIVTAVDPERVRVNEPFHDVARVTGSVPAGATVEFTAYAAVGHGEMPGPDTDRLLDAAHVRIECSVASEGDANGAADDGNDGEDSVCLARSPDVRSPSTGLVFWKAAVVSAAGDILASHELGVPGEVVTVTAVPDVALPVTGAGSVWRHVLVASVVLALALGLLLLRRMVGRRPPR